MQKFYALLVACGLWGTATYCQSFTPGNIVVVRVGDGSVSLDSKSQPVFLDEYSVTGQLVQSKALPTATNGNHHRLTLSGSAVSEGALTLSANKQYLCLAGYDTTVGAASVTSLSVGRVAAIVDANGNINTQTGIVAGSAYKTSNIRGAATNDGTGVWFSGAGSSSSGGTYYVPADSFTATPTKISAAPTNTRVVNVFGGQLYLSSASSTFFGVSEVGSGLPTTSGQTTTSLSGVNDSSSYAFVLFDVDATEPGNDLLYLVNDNTTKGGVLKYSKVAGTWVSNGRLASSNSFRGLALIEACGSVSGYVASQDSICAFTDMAGYNQPINASIAALVGKATNTVFRGIAFAPGTSAGSAPVASLGATTNVKCFGDSTGSATVNVTGGTGTITYAWSDNGTGASRNNLQQGVYSVTVSDQLGCTTVVTNIGITQPAAALGANVAKLDVACFGESNGSIVIAGTGGTAPYQYAWSSGNGTNLAAGVYTITVTDTNNCQLVKTDTVKQPAPLVLNAVKGNITCGSTNNGSLALNTAGGNGGNTYLWNDNDTTVSRSNLTAGAYSVTVTDSKGCTAERKDTILQTANLNVGGTATDVACYGGSNGAISVVTTGGTGNYNYTWSSSASGANPTNLAVGVYTVTVDDGTGCTGTQTFTVAQPDSLNLSGQVTNVSSAGGADGAIVLTVSGGTPNYDYDWGNSVVTKDRSNLTAGTYTVTVTDDKGCTQSSAFTVSQPTGLKEIGEIIWVKNAGTSGGNVWFEVNTVTTCDVHISTFTANGTLVAQQTVKDVSSQLVAINTESFVAGMYFVRFKAEGKTVTVKIAVSKQ